MAGLLNKAGEFRKRLGLEKTPAPSGDGLSDEEREEVARAMNAALGHNQLSVDSGTFTIKARKKGYLLPLLVNLAAILVVAAGVLLFSRLFALKGEADIRQLQLVSSGEGRLLETLRKEADANMASKNREIMDIQGRLEEVAREREKLSAGLESRLAEKEALLRQDLEAELARERKRLAASGLSQDEIASRLETVKKQVEDKSRQELVAYRARMDQEIRALEDDLGQREAQYQTLLDTARQDRTRLQRESQDRIKAMEDQLAAREAENRQALGQADERLKAAREEMQRLAGQRERQTRFDEQIQGWYQRIRQDLEAKNYDTLGATLDRFDAFLGSGEADEAPDLGRRREVERFFSSLVRELAEMRKRDAKTRGILEDSWLVEKARNLHAKAKEAQLRGDMAEAYRLYQEILQSMPETAQAWQALAAHQRAEDALSAARIPASPVPGTSNALNDGAMLALVKSAVEAPDWEAQKQKILDEAQAALAARTSDLMRENQDLANRVRDLGLRLAGIEQERNSLKSQARSDKALWDQEKNQLEAQLSLRLSELARYREAVDQGTALLQARQQELDAAGRQIASLEDQNAAGLARLGNLSSQNTDLASRLADLEARLRRAEAATPVPQPLPTATPAPTPAPRATPVPAATPLPVNPEQEARLAAAQAENQRLAEAYGRIRAELDRQEQELTAARAELKQRDTPVQPELPANTARLAQAEAAWNQYVGQVSLDSLKSGTSTLQARLKLDAFLALPEVNALFPGLYLHVKEYNRLFEESGSRTLLIQLSDLVYSAGSYSDPAERQAFLAAKSRTSTDEDYRELLQLMADLME